MLSRVQLFATCMDGSPPDASVHGIFQARILEWVAISSSRGSSGPRDEPKSTTSPVLAGGFFTTVEASIQQLDLNLFARSLTLVPPLGALGSLL